jgi:hypothetical protein
MKTIREWLEELPEPHRTQAINNAEKYDMIDISVDSLIDAIGQGFIWRESPEGGNYWVDLIIKLKTT